jgi:iron complex transport system substrate-binding protein
VRYWFGDESDVIFPWAEDEAAGADPEILNMAFGELNYEKIASLQPDIITAVYSGITQREYELLSQIAPTVAQIDDYIDFGVPWDVHTRTMGRALGLEQRAQQLVAGMKARIDEVRAAHPEWEGQGIVVATPSANEGQFSAFASGDPRSQFFTSLGFEVPAQIDQLAGDSFYVDFSDERLGLLDTDLLVWDQLSYLPGDRATIEAHPVLGRLDAMRDGRAVFLPEDLEYAFAFNSVLSLPYFLAAWFR